MNEEKGTIRIVAEKLGTVTQVIEFLTEFENAYKNIYAFEFIVDSLRNEFAQHSKNDQKRFKQLMNLWEEVGEDKKIFEDTFLIQYFLSDGFLRYKETPNLINIQSQIDINRLLLPNNKLRIEKVNIQSVGFWEFFGCMNPLNQIREYLKDRHERKKDKNYRERQEEGIGELEITERQNRILKQRIEILKSLGYDMAQIRQMVNSLVREPLNRLNRFQDNGQIEGTDQNYRTHNDI